MPTYRGKSCCCKKVVHCNQCPSIVIVLSLPDMGDSASWCGLNRRFEFCGESSSGGLPTCSDSSVFKYLGNYGGGTYISLDIAAACMDGLISETSSQIFNAYGQWTKDPTTPPSGSGLTPGTKDVQCDIYMDATLLLSTIKTVGSVVPVGYSGTYWPCPEELFLQITCGWPCTDASKYMVG